MMTQFRRVNATVNSDPEKKSRTFVAPIKQGYLISQTRASEVTRIRPTSVLALPRWLSPNFKGRIFAN
jgi:hypothetical protein